jgi:hypothetical protein
MLPCVSLTFTRNKFLIKDASTAILLSTRKLQQLHQMLDMAETELQSQQLMSLLSGE